MHSHPNARRTALGRVQVFAAVEAGMTVSAACLAYRVSRRWYSRWRPRWDAQGLCDRSLTPRPGRRTDSAKSSTGSSRLPADDTNTFMTSDHECWNSARSAGRVLPVANGGTWDVALHSFRSIPERKDSGGSDMSIWQSLRS